MLELNRIYNMDSREGLLKIDDGSIDLIITSPPYKEKDGYDPEMIEEVFNQLFRVHKNNSLFFLNFGHLVEDKSRPFKVLEMAGLAGFELNETITWKKTQFSPIIGERRLNNLTEFIFLLYNGKMPTLDRLSVSVPYQDKSNIGRYSDKDLRCAGNFWEFGYETIQRKSQKLHNDRFPLELPLRCIKLSNVKSGIVLDPFIGSGTTALAAKQMGLNYIGFELKENNCKIAEKRLI